MLNIYRRHPSDKCITTILKHSVIWRSGFHLIHIGQVIPDKFPRIF
jgi:hypothetical protein